MLLYTTIPHAHEVIAKTNCPYIKGTEVMVYVRTSVVCRLYLTLLA